MDAFHKGDVVRFSRDYWNKKKNKLTQRFGEHSAEMELFNEDQDFTVEGFLDDRLVVIVGDIVRLKVRPEDAIGIRCMVRTPRMSFTNFTEHE